MLNKLAAVTLVSLGVIASVLGCAPAYRSYSDCCVPYGYCAPPPLPYTHFADCECSQCEPVQDMAESGTPLEPASRESDGGRQL